MAYTYEVARRIGATPKRLFEAWLDSREHSAMTGAGVTVGPGQGDAFSTTDGLVTGVNLEVEPYHRIVHSWNIAQPGGGNYESRLEVLLATGPNYGGLPGSAADGATIIVRHSNLPPEQTLFNPQWWEERYFKPMDAYFARANARFMRPPPRSDSPDAPDIVRFSEHLVHRGFAYAYAMSVADITGNGSLDIVAADTNVGLYLFENDGKGNFARHVVRRRIGEWLERHAIADINGDGKLEIVSVDNTNGCLLYFEYDGDPRETSSWRHRYITEGGLPGAYDLTIADLDGDGDLDVAASGWRIGNQFAWFENRNGLWVKHMIEEGLPETRAIRAVDLDGDGLPDLLGAVSQGNALVWYRNPGDPRTEPWEKHVIDTGVGPHHGDAVDMDGDGDLDVVMAVRGSDASNDEGLDQIVWYENEGSPEVGPWKKHVIAESFPMAFEAVAGDIDGDGQVEVVATGWGDNGRLALFKHQGDPRGPWRMQLLKEGWANATQVIIADLDGDGRLDIAACAERGSNELRWWRNEGTADD